MIEFFTKQVVNNFEDRLTTFHSLFSECSAKAEYLEELLARSLQRDDSLAQQGVVIHWKGFSHNISEDILVVHGDERAHLSIKTGQIKKNNMLRVSGYRLQKVLGPSIDLKNATQFLHDGGKKAVYIACPSSRKKDGSWNYTLYKITTEALCPDINCNWVQPVYKKDASKKRVVWQTTNTKGVLFELCPTMSWQIWWEVPITLLNEVANLNIPCRAK